MKPAIKCNDLYGIRHDPTPRTKQTCHTPWLEGVFSKLQTNKQRWKVFGTSLSKHNATCFHKCRGMLDNPHEFFNTNLAVLITVAEKMLRKYQCRTMVAPMANWTLGDTLGDTLHNNSAQHMPSSRTSAALPYTTTTRHQRHPQTWSKNPCSSAIWGKKNYISSTQVIYSWYIPPKVISLRLSTYYIHSSIPKRPAKTSQSIHS